MKRLTDAELLLLGLVAEMPRHGYQLHDVIKRRAIREWTHIAFSSIYFVLGRLEKRGLARAACPPGARPGAKAPRVYSITPAGRRALAAQTRAALGDVRPSYSSLLLGMINWPALKRGQALRALQVRSAALEAEQARLSRIHAEQQPLPDYLEALFEYSLGQLRAEARWVARTLDYMATKPWLE